MVLTRVLVLGLMTLSSGVRDGVELHGLHLESARGQISRTVPLKINAAIRHAKGLAASHLKELTAQQAWLHETCKLGVNNPQAWQTNSDPALWVDMSRF